MALSAALDEGGNPPDSIKTEAAVFLRFIDGARTIAKIDLDVTGSVPGIEEATFLETAEEAKKACPVSRALAGVPEINPAARLA
jgi:osmotically inducible protein OsmC